MGADQHREEVSGDSSAQGKTLIGILASHDSVERNNSLARLLEKLWKKDRELLDEFRFLFTGGTYERLVLGSRAYEVKGIEPVRDEVREFLIPRSMCLPSRIEGGVTLLAYTIASRHCSILWPFLTPLTAHWLNPENLALTRLSDQWHVKRLMNSGSVWEWFCKEAEIDKDRNRQAWPMNLKLDGTEVEITPERLESGGFRIKRPKRAPFSESIRGMTIALIAHDKMKSRMIDFAIDYEPELARFGQILSTGTTGREVSAATRKLVQGKNLYRYSSGPKGGDIEIATEVLFGNCHVVIFFIDPLNPHPHIEDIRVVFGACMIQDEVRMLTNEMQAREWMERVVKRGQVAA